MIFRLKVFLPAVLLVALVTYVVSLKLEVWLKHWIEDGISAITQTRTDISHLELSFKNSSLKLKRLEIASSEDEFKNLIEFENIVIDFQTLPLLQKRLVIDNFSITGLAWGTKRTRSGFLPPKPPAPPSWLSKEFDKAFSSLKTEMAELPIAKLLDFDIPKDPRELVNLVDLKSIEAFKQTTTFVEEKKSEWTEKMKELRDISEYEKRFAEVKQFVDRPPQNPQDVLKAVETIQSTVQYFENEKKRAEDLIHKISDDAQKVTGQVDAAQKALADDYERAKKVLSLEDLSVDHFSKILFGPEWVQRVNLVLTYHKMLRSLLASKPADEGVEVKKRAKGRDIIFIKEKKEPGFLLSKSEFSVNGIEQGDRKMVSQIYRLKLDSINSAPRIYSKPMEIELSADLKHLIVDKIFFDAVLDYTKPVDREEFKVGLQNFKAEDWPVGIPNVFDIRMSKGVANSETSLKFEGDELLWKSQVSFKDVVWDLKQIPKRGILMPIFDEVFQRLGSFELKMVLRSTKEGLDFDVDSDLDKKMKEAIDAGVRKKVAEFQERVRKEVDGRIELFRSQALKQVSSFQADVVDRIQGVISKLSTYSQEAEKAIDRVKKSGEDAARRKLQDEVQKSLPSGIPNPLKGIKRPF